MAKTKPKPGDDYVWVITQFFNCVPRVKRFVLHTYRKDYGVKVRMHGSVQWIRNAEHRTFCFSLDETKKDLIRRYEALRIDGRDIMTNAERQLALLRGAKSRLAGIIEMVEPDKPAWHGQKVKLDP